jgi:hypothetical protein
MKIENAIAFHVGQDYIISKLGLDKLDSADSPVQRAFQELLQWLDKTDSADSPVQRAFQELLQWLDNLGRGDSPADLYCSR